MKIIEPELGYDMACSKHHLDNTFVRRDFFSPPSNPHHVNYTICYHNQNRIDTPSGIHLNYLSRKPTQTGSIIISLIPYGLFHYQ